jgi:hypothetical protein
MSEIRENGLVRGALARGSDIEGRAMSEIVLFHDHRGSRR